MGIWEVASCSERNINMAVKIGEAGRSHVDEKVIASSREEQ